MNVDFITDLGFRLSHLGKSMVLGAISIGKPYLALSDRDIANMARVISDYESAIHGADALKFKSIHLTPADAPPLSGDVAYKFTDDLGLEFWQSGSIKLNPPSTYLNIENAKARDPREGRGLVYLRDTERYATINSLSGFNSLIICTSADARRSEREYRSNKFGWRIVKIHGASEFAAKIAALSGAERFTVRDVTYSDAKAVKGISDFPDQFAKINGVGDLKESTLAYIAEYRMEELIRVAEAASIFTKPLVYRLERERRFQFAFPADAATSITVEDAGLRDFIEVIA